MSEPHWQQHPCPEWCSVVHSEDDHPDDRSHRDEGFTVAAAVHRRRLAGTELIRSVEPTELTIGRWRRDGEQQLWFYLGEDHGFALELSEESFYRLTEAMRAFLPE